MHRVLLQTFVLLLKVFVSLEQPVLQLELIQVLMRHGERTPLLKETYPKDPYNESAYEPWGMGQLTNQGKLTEYRIGTMLRQRYSHFLDSLYRPYDIYAVSTEADRTKMSLQLMLAGLYPPDTRQMWNPDLPWLAIPTHYVPKRVDMLLKSEGCSIYNAALAEVKKTKEIRDKIAVYKDFLKFLSEKTGLVIEEPLRAYEIYNLLTAQKTMNLTLPEWCTDEVYRKMQDIVVLEYDIRSYTTQLKRLNGGMLIKKFLENMNLKNESTNPRKMYVYSGHEINLAAFARAHNISEPRLPDYGSMFIFEKLRDKENNLYIRIILWTGTTEKLVTIKLADCDEICSLKTYLNLVREVIPSEEETNCLWDNITKKELLELFAERLIQN
ncbi:Testicular acid phosphatase-like protein [Camponotus floridanus]|uniref:acid phosphatase n=1 Tax=Camponotus floridanus TaxID=104421 RepID=E2ARU9_CAMFO|nr:venom acid phosphatase Acph-1 isoform X2 [Camponotus floridanus]XP_019884391.1 venom acid phosphatase Acph-1 isoform X2 [Camponotus floridanus]EFN63832.1 Testicular acid phosphatase-like protein [Camponotus floridanus]